MKAALVTPSLNHLPFHPSCFLGYASAILTEKFEVDVIDLNAVLHQQNSGRLKAILDDMDIEPVVSDDLHLAPFYQEIENQIDRLYSTVNWQKYLVVYVTPPSWFPMVGAEEVLRLSRTIKRVSPETRILFLGSSLSSWTNRCELEENGVHTVHLNDIFSMGGSGTPVNYDLLAVPIYENRGKYLFDLLPFALKHGCSWGQCRFCSLSKGWNAGYLERSTKSVIQELETLIDRYDPAVLVCRDHSLNGDNLMEFCNYMEGCHKPWCGQSRADMSERKIKALSRAGCKEIYFGLESGSDRMLYEMNKGINSKQMSDFINRLYSNGILPVPSLIIGAPGEEQEDFEKTIQFLADHKPFLEVVNVYPFMATPASAFTSEQMQPDRHTAVRMFRFIETCKALGLKVILGEQSIEYFLFNRACRGRAKTY